MELLPKLAYFKVRYEAPEDDILIFLMEFWFWQVEKLWKKSLFKFLKKFRVDVKYLRWSADV